MMAGLQVVIVCRLHYPRHDTQTECRTGGMGWMLAQAGNTPVVLTWATWGGLCDPHIKPARHTQCSYDQGTHYQDL